MLGRFLRALRFPGPMIPAVAPLLLAAAGVRRPRRRRRDPAQLRAAAIASAGCSPSRRGSPSPRRSGSPSPASARYVRIDGRIDSDAEFEDADHRPLVLRRTTHRVATAGARRRAGRRVDDAGSRSCRSSSARASTRSTSTAAALADGLVVVPRESVGRGAATSATDRRPAIPPDAQARLRGRAGLDRRARHRRSACRAAAPTGGPSIGPGPRPAADPDDPRARRGDARPHRRRDRPRRALAIACLVAGAVLLAVAAAVVARRRARRRRRRVGPRRVAGPDAPPRRATRGPAAAGPASSASRCSRSSACSAIARRSASLATPRLRPPDGGRHGPTAPPGALTAPRQRLTQHANGLVLSAHWQEMWGS